MQPVDAPDEPYVCPGCYAAGGERCASWCIDAEIERERQERQLYVDPDRFDDEDDDDAPAAREREGMTR
jgi:hypothetical protein